LMHCIFYAKRKMQMHVEEITYVISERWEWISTKFGTEMYKGVSIISGTGAAICTAVVIVRYNSRW
jgi:hypothetical protein